MFRITSDILRWPIEWLWILIVVLPGLDCNKKEVDRYLSMGKEALSRGQYADALAHYHAAIDLDATNYHSLYIRATVYLALGRPNAAIPDLDRVIALKPDFSAARIQRGNVLFKQGHLDKAVLDYQNVITVDARNIEVSEKINTIADLKRTIGDADHYFDANNFAAAEKLYTKVIEICNWYAGAYEKRAKCHENSGDLQKAIADYRSVAKLLPDSTKSYLTTSILCYKTGDVEESLNQVRECLKLDPDHKECFSHYKKVKKLASMRKSLEQSINEQNWMNCLEKAEQILRFEKTVDNIQLDVYKHTCKCHVNAEHVDEAIAHCSEVLKYRNPNDVEVLCDRAEAYLLNEQFDEAIKDYQSALNAQENYQRAQEGIQRAKKRKKQHGRRDYYKILNVGRRASKQEINRAYRKLAQKWHPDNFQSAEDKKKAEKKFMDIAAAKEVLTDSEKRAQFDNGEDPLDPERQQGGFYNPFQGGFPFGGNGGPFSFQFHFG